MDLFGRKNSQILFILGGNHVDEDLIRRLANIPEDTSVAPDMRENDMISGDEFEECLGRNSRGLVHLHESDFIPAVNAIMRDLGLLQKGAMLVPPNISRIRQEFIDSAGLTDIISWINNELRTVINGEDIEITAAIDGGTIGVAGCMLDSSSNDISVSFGSFTLSNSVLFFTIIFPPLKFNFLTIFKVRFIFKCFRRSLCHLYCPSLSSTIQTPIPFLYNPKGVYL